MSEAYTIVVVLLLLKRSHRAHELAVAPRAPGCIVWDIQSPQNSKTKFSLLILLKEWMNEGVEKTRSMALGASCTGRKLQGREGAYPRPHPCSTTRASRFQPRYPRADVDPGLGDRSVWLEAAPPGVLTNTDLFGRKTGSGAIAPGAHTGHIALSAVPSSASPKSGIMKA